MAIYTYAEDGANLAAIDEAVQLSGMGALIEGMVSDGTTVSVNSLVELDAAQEAQLSGIVAGYADQPSIGEQVSAARAFGIALIEEYQLVMISEGIAQDPAAHDVAVAMALATQLTYTGDLVSLDVELAGVTPIATYLEQARINVIRNRVRAYLGLPPI